MAGVVCSSWARRGLADASSAVQQGAIQRLFASVVASVIRFVRANVRRRSGRSQGGGSNDKLSWAGSRRMRNGAGWRRFHYFISHAPDPSWTGPAPSRARAPASARPHPLAHHRPTDRGRGRERRRLAARAGIFHAARRAAESWPTRPRASSPRPAPPAGASRTPLPLDPARRRGSSASDGRTPPRRRALAPTATCGQGRVRSRCRRPPPAWASTSARRG